MTLALWPCSACGQWHSIDRDPCHAQRVVDLIAELMPGVELQPWQLALVRSVFGTSPADRRQVSGRSLPREGGGGRAEPSPVELFRAEPIAPERVRRCSACGSWCYADRTCTSCGQPA